MDSRAERAWVGILFTRIPAGPALGLEDAGPRDTDAPRLEVECLILHAFRAQRTRGRLVRGDGGHDVIRKGGPRHRSRVTQTKQNFTFLLDFLFMFPGRCVLKKRRRRKSSRYPVAIQTTKTLGLWTGKWSIFVVCPYYDNFEPLSLLLLCSSLLGKNKGIQTAVQPSDRLF